ncbi:MAG TPA: hypothetical protein VHX88_10140 [Solirubrobacteraceae bacterium]|nr:hypothetical protein [Solirubrobacteraceae bacterium]
MTAEIAGCADSIACIAVSVSVSDREASPAQAAPAPRFSAIPR